MRVVVLLSTWQGERFIEEQLRSILGSLPADGRIIVRDDGSTDGVVARIESLGESRVTVLRGENIGFARSFFTLLHAAPDDADLVMFSDQDDVWLPDKIGRAMAALAPLRDEPALYCSRLRLVDEHLHPLGLSPAWPRPPSFRNALVENIAFGCTCALNRAGLLLARRNGDERLLQFHDWWLYLVISAFGRVVADPEPTILYRQHTANSVGARLGWRRYTHAIRFLGRKNWVHAMFAQIDNFRRVHGDRLEPEDRRLLDRYFDPRRPSAVARLLLMPVRFRQRLPDEVLLRLLLLANLLSGRRLLPDAASESPRT
ncbi:glycosyltransferase family 2 protein [Ramlibacter sp.]|uniref:glycosyltransferase family 2 protein n=1 Tax=Ramlibacter sp. TaxID=1917967 RepID=UPI0026290D98|nr:glycosyltransferase family 2 protein [Ramlibacter sp.]MDB5954977.1 glycosyltransferase family 2 protein [Ramlibacter sp.]